MSATTQWIGGCCDPQPLPPLGVHVDSANTRGDISRLHDDINMLFTYPSRIGDEGDAWWAWVEIDLAEKFGPMKSKAFYTPGRQGDAIV